VDYVKANPGKLAFGSAGTGTLNHLSGELPHVPYRGAGPAIADAIGGQVDAAVNPVPDWTTAQFDAFMTSELARWTPLVKAIGVRLD
jgi:tripartite-type tricarboxylate transporter receptor subunit TctC